MDLPTFDLHSIPDGSTVFVVSSDTDQTTRLIQEILRVKSDIPHSVIFSNDRLCTSELVKQDILDRQSKLFSERHISPEIDRRMIAIFDDCFVNMNGNESLIGVYTIAPTKSFPTDWIGRDGW